MDRAGLSNAAHMTDPFAPVREMFEPGSEVIPAFDYLMAYSRAASFRLLVRESEVRAVELQWPDRKRNPFSVQGQASHLNFYLRRPILGEHPGLFDAAVAKFGPVRPNRLGEYRHHLRTIADVDDMLDFLREWQAWPSQRTHRRFAAETFEKVTCQHLLDAARGLADGNKDHPFGQSTDYEVISEG